MSKNTSQAPIADNQAQAYEQIQHQHVELVRQLEMQNYIFAQDPKVITETLLLAKESAYDRLFVRANKIDSTGELMTALEQLFLYINSSKRLIYALHFVLAMAGVIALLGSQMLNFFYVLLALLGWHSLSLLFWCVQIFGKNRPSLLMAWLQKLLMLSPVRRAFDRNQSVQNAVMTVLKQQISPVQFWYFSHIVHTAWLFALLGSMVGLFGLFLFQRYEFSWSSTLLSKQHFDMMIGILGFIPAKLGLVLPKFGQSQPAQFAWLIMACLALYGVLPRLLAWAVCAYRKRVDFTIDVSLPYYDQLLKKFGQTVIDQDDYQPNIIKSQTMVTLSENRIFADFEYAGTAVTDERYFGVVDDGESIDRLLNLSNQNQAQIQLAISTHRPPDRGVMRKIKRLQASNQGLVALLSHGTHQDTWHLMLVEQGVMVLIDD